MNVKSHSFPVAILLFYYSASALLLLFLIPPFQNPDEPQHFLVNLIYTFGVEHKVELEEEVIEYMDTNNFWRYIGSRKPTERPDKLSEIEFIQAEYVDPQLRYNSFYHYILNSILKITQLQNTHQIYYLFRLVSILLTLGSILFCFLALKQLHNIVPSFSYFAVLMLLFLPQFIINSVTANPDTLAIFWGALFFYALCSLIAGKSLVIHSILLVFSAGAGLFTDRSCFILFFIILLLPFFYKPPILHKLRGLFPILFLLIAILILAWFVWLFPVESFSLLKSLFSKLQSGLSHLPRLFSISPFNTKYLMQLADSTLLSFGWMAYRASNFAYILWRGFLFFSLLGIVVYLAQSYFPNKMNRQKIQGFKLERNVIFLFLIAVCVQGIGLWLFQGSQKILPQGRYFFPLIFPVVFLLNRGTGHFFSVFNQRTGKIAVYILTLLLFLFTNFCIWYYVVPVFHLSIQSPFSGM